MADLSLKPSDARIVGLVSEEFLAKYNRPGPRYTSYPTAPVWKDDFGPDDLEKQFAGAKKRARRSRSTCTFPSAKACACSARATCRFTRTSASRIPYLETLKKEIEHVGSDSFRKSAKWCSSTGAAARRPISRPAQMEDLFGYTRERFSFAPDAEIGIEVDPRVTTREHLETLRRLGFNRLSLGIQDFDAKVQQTIHRIQPYEMTRDLIAVARDRSASTASTST